MQRNDIGVGYLIVQALLATIECYGQEANPQCQETDYVAEVTQNRRPQIDRFAIGSDHLDVGHHLTQCLPTPRPEANEASDIDNPPAYYA
jgi:hypothetical protein